MSSKIFLLYILSFFCFLSLSPSQTGVIIDKQTGLPAPGCTVSLGAKQVLSQPNNGSFNFATPVFFNSSKNILKITISPFSKVHIIDVRGKIISTLLDPNSKTQQIEIDPRSFLKVPGIYFLKVTNGSEVNFYELGKFNIEHNSLSKRSSQIADTLSISCDNYLPKKVEVSTINVGQIEIIKTPNILLVYTDDLGYGDITFSNPNSKIPTPNMDQLAREGMIFTDAHSPYGICGPSRYGLLTGRYSWRNLGGSGNGDTFSNMRIDPTRLTLASMLKSLGYNTAQVGKWGLRHNYEDALKSGVNYSSTNLSPSDFDFPNKKLLGANLIGFDYAWSLTHVSTNKNAKKAFENGLPLDPTLGNYDAHDWLPDSEERVIDFLQVYAGQQVDTRYNIDRTKPFFMYWDPHVPHEPIVPNAEFIGKSQAGAYGDFVYEFDHRLGNVMLALKDLGLEENTLVIVTSDNGPENTAYNRAQSTGHYSMGSLRGVKRDLWEGGTRVPFVAKWPKIIETNVSNDKTICFSFLLATFADMHGYALPNDAGEDSFIFFDELTGENPSYPDFPIIYGRANDYALRKGKWVYFDNNYDNVDTKEPSWFQSERGSQSHNLNYDLYDLDVDPQQLVNVASQNSNVRTQMAQELTNFRNSGRTRP